MSQSGQITFYTEEPLTESERVLHGALALTGAKYIAFAWRTLVEDERWEAFRRAMVEGASPEPVEVDDDAVLVMADRDDIPEELVGRQAAIEDVAELYRPGSSLTVHIGQNTLGPEISSAVCKAIGTEICGNFVPHSPLITLGWHDIFESSEHEEGFLFGRAFFSFRLFGYGTPNNWSAYRETVFSVPAIKELGRSIERLGVPDLKRCVMWDI